MLHSDAFCNHGWVQGTSVRCVGKKKNPRWFSPREYSQSPGKRLDEWRWLDESCLAELFRCLADQMVTLALNSFRGHLTDKVKEQLHSVVMGMAVILGGLAGMQQPLDDSVNQLLSFLKLNSKDTTENGWRAVAMSRCQLDSSRGHRLRLFLAGICLHGTQFRQVFRSLESPTAWTAPKMTYCGPTMLHNTEPD